MLEKQRRKQLRQAFNAQDDQWRIEAVIHDGNWYDLDKWRRVAKVPVEMVEEWIENNEDILIQSEEGSYRVGHDEVVRWYDEQEIDIEESIIPNNFPPRLWAGQTETDIFLSAPRRRVSTVSFVVERDGILEKVQEILKGVARVAPDKLGRYRAYGLSAIHMRNLLSKGLTEDEFDSLDIKTRSVLMQRELTDLPEEWVEQALHFYTNKFAPNALKSSMSTISIYLPDRADIHAQTIIWVIRAIQKFDETASVPFAGYLSTVLRHWPYNLPDEYLGKELSRFQRERKKAIDQALEEGYPNNNVPNTVIADIMNMSLEEYIENVEEHETWLATMNATTLTWQDSANEKKGTTIGPPGVVESDSRKLFQISLAAIKAAVDTKEWDCAYRLISQIDIHEVDMNLRDGLTTEYLLALQKHLGEIMQRFGK